MRCDGFARIEFPLEGGRGTLTTDCQLLDLERSQLREGRDVAARHDERVARIRGASHFCAW